jgi:hypothetical protein
LGCRVDANGKPLLNYQGQPNNGQKGFWRTTGDGKSVPVDNRGKEFTVPAQPLLDASGNVLIDGWQQSTTGDGIAEDAIITVGGPNEREGSYPSVYVTYWSSKKKAELEKQGKTNESWQVTVRYDMSAVVITKHMAQFDGIFPVCTGLPINIYFDAEVLGERDGKLDKITIDLINNKNYYFKTSNGVTNQLPNVYVSESYFEEIGNTIDQSTGDMIKTSKLEFTFNAEISPYTLNDMALPQNVKKSAKNDFDGDGRPDLLDQKASLYSNGEKVPDNKVSVLYDKICPDRQTNLIFTTATKYDCPELLKRRP